MVRVVAIATLAGVLAGCASLDPPQRVDDACAILEGRKDWWRALKQTERRWDTPPELVLAIVRQESSFTHDARPPRRDGFLFIPGKRPSTAFGYAQALDTTWAQYRSETGRHGADRDEFGDAADFVGWYVQSTSRRLNIPPTNYRAHYLAYHEGAGGYSRGTWRRKKWLIDVADRVAANAAVYRADIERCERRLNDGFWFF